MQREQFLFHDTHRSDSNESFDTILMKRRSSVFAHFHCTKEFSSMCISTTIKFRCRKLILLSSFSFRLLYFFMERKPTEILFDYSNSSHACSLYNEVCLCATLFNKERFFIEASSGVLYWASFSVSLFNNLPRFCHFS